ncbi:AbrB/MazE/SpoVT family DNA-binding domain-containing protein [Paenibacillus melissococcoides]
MQSYNKKLSKSGSVTLPAVIRREYGLSGGEKFNIIVDSEDGTILLQRTQGSCLFCRSDKELVVYSGRFVCSQCIQNLEANVTERRAANAFEGGDGR